MGLYLLNKNMLSFTKNRSVLKLVRQNQSIGIRFRTTKPPYKNYVCVLKLSDKDCMCNAESSNFSCATRKIWKSLTNHGLDAREMMVLANAIGLPVIYMLQNPPMNILTGSMAAIVLGICGCIIGDAFPPAIFIVIFVVMIVGYNKY